MPKTLDDYSSLAVCADPGEWEESRRLTITSAERARCELTVEDGGSVRWDYRPRSGRRTDPAEMTGLVLRVLGGADADEPQPRARPGVALKGMVGRALATRGLTVSLEVYEDPDYYDNRGDQPGPA